MNICVFRLRIKSDICYSDVGQNYLTGPLSPSVGNLSRMQWMTFGINALSGEIPPELGRLTDLRSLSFGTNNFNGSLSSELGNLRRLEQLYINSAGPSGEIPRTFANLSSLVTVRGQSYLDLTEKEVLELSECLLLLLHPSSL
ncbi:probable LRR receptor-like serine/threonine-protein kinase [Tanacetum coccineum]